MADAKKNQDSLPALEGDLAKKGQPWREAWATAGRTERIKARYGLGRELQSLLKDHDDTRSHRKAVRQCCYELTKDSTAAYQLLGVAKGVPRELIDKACHKDSCVTWTHLLVVAWVEDREQQLEVFEECEANRWSAQKLQDWIVENYTITGGVEKTRFTVLTRSLGRMLEKTNRLVEQVLAADPRGKPQSTALAEAATRVKDSQSKEALKTLDATMEELQALKDQRVKLNQALRGAKKLISKKVGQEG